MAKVGRPKAVNWTKDQVELFGRFRATYETMADYYGVDHRTIDRLMEDDNEFCHIYKKSLSNSKMSLHERNSGQQ